MFSLYRISLLSTSVFYRDTPFLAGKTQNTAETSEQVCFHICSRLLSFNKYVALFCCVYHPSLLWIVEFTMCVHLNCWVFHLWNPYSWVIWYVIYKTIFTLMCDVKRFFCDVWYFFCDIWHVNFMHTLVIHIFKGCDIWYI